MPCAPALRLLLSRAWRLRCPACGRGPVFARGIVRARTCDACGRLLDRDEGHWLGGAEVLMFGGFGLGTLLAVPIVVVADLEGWYVHGLGLAYLAATAAAFRVSRALFLALDYAIDPSEEGPPGPRRDPEDAPAPPPPRRRRRPALPVPA